jgi:hypothetical protein
MYYTHTHTQYHYCHTYGLEYGGNGALAFALKSFPINHDIHIFVALSNLHFIGFVLPRIDFAK